jgi:hypothetical protein
MRCGKLRLIPFVSITYNLTKRKESGKNIGKGRLNYD